MVESRPLTRELREHRDFLPAGDPEYDKRSTEAFEKALATLAVPWELTPVRVVLTGNVNYGDYGARTPYVKATCDECGAELWMAAHDRSHMRYLASQLFYDCTKRRGHGDYQDWLTRLRAAGYNVIAQQEDAAGPPAPAAPAARPPRHHHPAPPGSAAGPAPRSPRGPA
jgi:hypothetical protein